LALAGHPLRWRLLKELTYSDRQVSELTARVGERQSLVSYHLGRLRSGGLVTSRRSSADGRDAYYRVDLATCAGLLTSAGAALHPGLALTVRGTSEPATTTGGRVLFLCTGNSARSQMAEALLQHATNNRVEVFSAGSHPTRLHPNAVRVLRGYGIALTGRRAKHLDEFAGQRFDYVVTLCDRVREVCPDFLGPGHAVHWSMANPAEEGDTDRATYPAFERTAAELATRIHFFITLLQPQSEVP
jgi:protein-tyrosine-phosphatase/DNA-binding transcriptional ArsR family regulator